MRPNKARCYDIALRSFDPSKHLVPRRTTTDFPESLSRRDLHDLIDGETRMSEQQAAKEWNW